MYERKIEITGKLSSQRHALLFLAIEDVFELLDLPPQLPVLLQLLLLRGLHLLHHSLKVLSSLPLGIELFSKSLILKPQFGISSVRLLSLYPLHL